MPMSEKMQKYMQNMKEMQKNDLCKFAKQATFVNLLLRLTLKTFGEEQLGEQF